MKKAIQAGMTNQSIETGSGDLETNHTQTQNI